MTINYKERFSKFGYHEPGRKRGFFLIFDIDFNTEIEPLFMLLDYLKAYEVIGSVAFFETDHNEFDLIEYLHEFYPQTLENGVKVTKNTILLIREQQHGLITGVPNTIPAWHKRYSQVYDEKEMKDWDYKKRVS